MYSVKHVVAHKYTATAVTDALWYCLDGQERGFPDWLALYNAVLDECLGKRGIIAYHGRKPVGWLYYLGVHSDVHRAGPGMYRMGLIVLPGHEKAVRVLNRSYLDVCKQAGVSWHCTTKRVRPGLYQSQYLNLR